MAMYLSRYPLPRGDTATTEVFAKDSADLGEILAKRGMGEQLLYAAPDREPPVMPSEHLARGELAAGNHALIWAAMIGTRAGVVEPWELLNDNGIVHRMAHALHSRELQTWQNVPGDLLAEVFEFERKVPGLHPCWGGEPAPAPIVEFDYAQDFYRTADGGAITAMQALELSQEDLILRGIRTRPIVETPFTRAARWRSMSALFSVSIV